MRVYFDACVLIAGLLSSAGGSALLITLVKKNVIIGITSETVLDEVLSKTGKIRKSENEIRKFIATSNLIIRQAITQEEIISYSTFIDKDDAHVLAGANLTRCNYLVTLDKKHLLRPDIQKQSLPLRIVSPKELLDKLVSK
jgi:putative PIN family toxin of toxin-antitoxin system